MKPPTVHPQAAKSAAPAWVKSLPALERSKGSEETSVCSLPPWSWDLCPAPAARPFSRRGPGAAQLSSSAIL